MRYSDAIIQELRKKEFNDREQQLKNAVREKLIKTSNIKNKLHITYVMTWTGICGGSKIILEHANKLTERGHKITIISHDERPEWFPINPNVTFMEISWKKRLGDCIPNCDLIIATYWREIYECVQQKKAPVIYFEQGDFHLFDLDSVDERTFKYIEKQFNIVNNVYTVSNFAKEKIKEIYNHESIVIPNAVDEKIFYEPEYDEENNLINISLIGSVNSEFKKISIILKALELLKHKGYNFEINWITPDKPENPIIDPIVNPPQSIIGEILRKSDIFVCASMYESFCLPVLEAMACGNAIVTTNNGGNMDFVRNNENALIIKKDNVQDIYDKVKLLIEDKDLRKKLALNAINTAKQYSWKKTIDKIETYYRDIALYRVQN